MIVHERCPKWKNTMASGTERAANGGGEEEAKIITGR
jgi:hypothetical protein